eukprot:TRINITY_DN6127_c0_g1_i2.p1 TRINITY_DN6127_c0_g1~~TRINITY_DN6127_c0_g1_i2.p1  ORF type:complete len:446 (-),score=102.58 TRINITY_DN6127_c0_g1_i2:160-1404(-)
MEDLYESALELKDIDNEKTISMLSEVLESDSAKVTLKEKCIDQLNGIYKAEKNIKGLVSLIRDNRVLYKKMRKSRVAKIIRGVFNDICEMGGDDSFGLQIEIANEIIDWCKAEKKSFLKQKMEVKLATVLLKGGQYNEALAQAERMEKETKKMDDKLLLIDIYIVISKIYHKLQNIPKSKAALTSGRMCTNQAYCGSRTLAEIERHNGVLLTEERLYSTAYSYFVEAFEGFSAMDAKDDAINCLQYMIMCKILAGGANEVQGILISKKVSEFVGKEMDLLRAIAGAAKESSIRKFDIVISKHQEALAEDEVLSRHLQELYDTLLEDNLVKITKPFEMVEVSHVAELIELPHEQVERKLAQMILDDKLLGTLDQGNGMLILFDEPDKGETFESALESIQHLDKVVDSLFTKSEKL